MSKNSNLKKKIGESAYKFLNRNYNDDFLSEHLPSLFGLLSDIKYIKEDEYPKLKVLLNTKIEEQKKEKPPTKTAKQLLDEAGFILIDDITCRDDYMKFDQYYKKAHRLCKFYDYDATKRYHKLFWILRKGFEDILPLDKSIRTRQDIYSTSSMSVGISKDTQSVMQITSRYNHKVAGCDNTYNSNLDNIVSGLTDAFNADYNLNLKKSSIVEFDNFYSNGGKLWYYHMEISGKKFGNNTIDGVYYDPSQYLIFDTYILDIKNKVLENAVRIQDDFVNIINNKLKKGDKIEIRKGEPDENINHNGKIVIYVN